MMPPTPIISLAFTIIAGVTGVSLYLNYSLPLWLCTLIVIPIIVIGLWLNNYLWDKQFNKNHNNEQGD